MPASPAEADAVVVERGPNIKPIPVGKAPEKDLACKLILKIGDNITTDHIMPAGTKILPYRSNVPKLSEFCFTVCDKEFPERAKREGGGIVVGGANYGQGSSREHAALVPLYLGVKAVASMWQISSISASYRSPLKIPGIMTKSQRATSLSSPALRTRSRRRIR